MTQILTNGRLVDHSVLVIAGGEHDGKRADRLRLTQLYPALERMGIAGINPKMGKNELLAVYFAQAETVAERISPPPSTGRRPPPLSEMVARQAAKLIASGHAGRPDEEIPSTAPIASTSTRAAR